MLHAARCILLSYGGTFPTHLCWHARHAVRLHSEQMARTSVLQLLDGAQKGRGAVQLCHEGHNELCGLLSPAWHLTQLLRHS